VTKRGHLKYNMKYSITFKTKVEAHCQADAELMAFDKLGYGEYEIDVEEVNN